MVAHQLPGPVVIRSSSQARTIRPKVIHKSVDNQLHRAKPGSVPRVDEVRVSKRLSFVLRHRPDSVGLTLDDGGWVAVDDLLAALASHGLRLKLQDLQHVMATSDKKRFVLSGDGTRIRAAQGHSVEVELGYATAQPPEVLFHGTSVKSVDAIERTGLIKQNRHAVHLSPDVETAIKVGSRRGQWVVFRVDAARMAVDGHQFAVSDNGVWLTEHVPAKYLRQQPNSQ